MWNRVKQNVDKKEISFLILTHKRPHLFKRCIESVINNCPQYFREHIEIIVNNSSLDIEEITNDDIRIKYFYNTSSNLSDLYTTVYDNSNGKFVYFLDDDDFILTTFFKNIIPELDNELIMFGYIPYDVDNIKKFKIFLKNITSDYKSLDDYFRVNLNLKYFQFGQYMFKKDCLNREDFPTDNCLFNDYKIIWHIKHTKFKYINKTLYKQTTDGRDNISFKEYCKDKRWKQVCI